MPGISEDQLQERLDNYVELIDEGGIIQDEGVENVITGMNNKAYLQTDEHPVHSFSLPTLRRYPRYLCDSILMPHTTSVSLDNHLYWGWTAACVSHSQTEGKQNNSETLGLMQDFYSLVHLCLLPIRQTTMDQRISQFIQSMNPSIQGVQHQGYSLACSTGFSLLEGLIRRHCSDLQAGGGLTHGHIQTPSWRSTPVEDPIYHDELQIWKEREASEEVSQTLNEIDELQRYPEDVLTRKIGGGEEIINDRSNFLSVLSDQRNINIHGELSTQAIGPVVLNLCCLLLWDQMDEDEFESTQEEIYDRLNRQSHAPMSGIHPRWPSAFYPL
jgi:hypothetical protein